MALVTQPRFWTFSGAVAVLFAAVGCRTDDLDDFCLIDGKIYPEGSEVPSIDNCNSCSCSNARRVCTLMACPEPVACGARAGDTCSDDEYCAYEEGALCGQADATAICKPRPELCPDIYDPVCGCDGVTYSSSCAAARAGVGYFNRGTCGDAGGASCDVNGATYPDGSNDIPAPDGCNVCSCNDGNLACTERACEDGADTNAATEP
jgi:hypothetical protein